MPEAPRMKPKASPNITRNVAPLIKPRAPDGRSIAGSWVRRKARMSPDETAAKLA